MSKLLQKKTTTATKVDENKCDRHFAIDRSKRKICLFVGCNGNTNTNKDNNSKKTIDIVKWNIFYNLQWKIQMNFQCAF